MTTQATETASNPTTADTFFPPREAIIEQARALFAQGCPNDPDDGSLKIDDGALIGATNDQAKVECWLWVSANEAGVMADHNVTDKMDRYRTAARHPNASVDADAFVAFAGDPEEGGGAWVQGWVTFSPGVGPVAVSSPVPNTTIAPTDGELITQAQARFETPGDLEIEPKASSVVRIGNEARIKCWVWADASLANLASDDHLLDKQQKLRAVAQDRQQDLDVTIHDDAAVTLEANGALVFGWVSLNIAEDAPGDSANEAGDQDLAQAVTDKQIIDKAKELFTEDGALEIDGDAHIERGDNGEQIECWVWVDAYDAGIDEDADEDEASDRYRSQAEHAIAEIDADAKVSLGDDDGAYVQGWITANIADALDDDDEDEPFDTYRLNCLVPSRNLAPDISAVVHITDAFAARMAHARQTLKSVPEAHTITLSAAGCVEWPREALAKTGIRLTETANELTEHTRVEVGLETVAFFTDSPYGDEGDQLSTTPEPVDMGE